MSERPTEQSPPHIDLLAIDAVRAGEGREEDRRHLESCAACRALLTDLQAIAADLHQVSPPPFAVPEELERTIVWLGRKQAMVARKRPHRALSIGLRWAVAASVIVTLGILATARRPRQFDSAERGGTRMAAGPGGDINGDGRVDILDAFALARAVGAGGGSNNRWDVNGDGVVDDRDVDRLARAAVSLGGTS
jgi:hypothetical protein